MNAAHLQKTIAFIREYRSNEGNFDRLYKKLEEEADSSTDENYRNSLQEIKEKWAEEYRSQKESVNGAWPEFEKFVSEFEKTVLNASKTAVWVRFFFASRSFPFTTEEYRKV